MQEKGKNPPSQKYQKVFQEFIQEFNRKKQECESFSNNTQQGKNHQIAIAIYRFVQAQLQGRYKDFDSLAKNISEGNTQPTFWQFYAGVSLVSIFISLLDLALELEKSEKAEEAEDKKTIEYLRKLSDQVPGHQEILWGSIKLGIVGSIFLGALAAIVTAAVILAKPAFLMLIFAVASFALLYYAFDPSLFSNFYKSGFSKDLDKLADQVQEIINSPNLEPKQAAKPLQDFQKITENSFGSIYQPDPDSEQTKRPTTQDTQINATSTSKKVS